MNPKGKYVSFPVIKLENREWPNRKITQAPIWCSVDLRDGNQALATPMSVEQKMIFFDTLIACGFKEIEVGFPAASLIEAEFVKRLIKEDKIPNDVTIQVLTPAREDLIKITCELLIGVKKVIIHMYNSTSPAQRRIVFGLEKPEIIELAVQGTKWVKQYASFLGEAEVRLQYSPESFSATEVEFALDVCEAVAKEWKPTQENKIIFNLPETVQVAMSNVYADQVEWFCRHVSCRDSIIVSLHTHNDRGTGVASTELGLLAGADRVEGTLFGNGERTGNLDIITVALNLYTQGIDPKLDFSNINQIRKVYEECTGMTVPSRQPYSGELVLTAFSGSHQDAIRKGLIARWGGLLQSGLLVWDVPYLTIDPIDIGRDYKEVIRVTSQSGKSGKAYILENEYKIYLPKDMQREFGDITSKLVDNLGREVKAEEIKTMFWGEYIDRTNPYSIEYFYSTNNIDSCECNSIIKIDNAKAVLVGKGNGPIDAFINSLHDINVTDVCVLDQSEHTLGLGSDAKAIAYIKLKFSSGKIRWGAGIDTSIQLASVKAVISALNRE
ncbi:MAG: 2-isopropylmalate synthase [Minisyncoccia bacterium]